MCPWTCPNSKCAFDKELQQGQYCPLCGEGAKEFRFSELKGLWRQKWEFKRSAERAKRHGKVVTSRKFCPKCGSANISVPAFYRPSTWRCLDCGCEGAFIVEDSQLADKIRERYRKDDEC